MVIDAIWQETFKRILVTLDVLLPSRVIQEKRARTDSSEPEGYAVLYDDLFDTHEAKRCELKEVTNPPKKQPCRVLAPRRTRGQAAEKPYGCAELGRRFSAHQEATEEKIKV